jgi:ferredoxin
MCENAPCLKAATGGAIYRRSDGIVLIDPVKSIGQSQLVAACPYGRIYWNKGSNIPQKCTFCAHLVDQGKTPRCVEACPLSAITFGDLDDPNSAISAKKAAIQPERMHPEYGSSPLVSYGGLPKPFLRGKVVDGKTGRYIQGATVTLIAPDGTTSTATTDNYADFEFKALKTGKMYTLQAIYPGMLPKTLVVFLDQAKDIGKVPLSAVV